MVIGIEEHRWKIFLRLVSTKSPQFITRNGSLLGCWNFPATMFSGVDLAEIKDCAERLFVGQFGIQSAAVELRPDGTYSLLLPACSYEQSMDRLRQAHRDNQPKIFRDREGVSWIQFSRQQDLDNRVRRTLVTNIDAWAKDEDSEQPMFVVHLVDPSGTSGAELFSSVKRVFLAAGLDAPIVVKSGDQVKVAVPAEIFDHTINALSQSVQISASR